MKLNLQNRSITRRCIKCGKEFTTSMQAFQRASMSGRLQCPKCNGVTPKGGRKHKASKR